MNNKGLFGLGFAFLLVFFIIAMTTFAFIEPFKENLDTARGGSGINTDLNCPGTLTHNVADYENDTTFEKLVKRPTCFVTGNIMVLFVFAVLFVGITWVVKNWRKP